MITPQYLAGLIDGDGCLFINFGIAKRLGRALQISPTVSITLATSEGWLFEEITNDYGGKYRPAGGGKRAFQWVCENRRTVYSLLSQVLPYLKLKARQAELLLDALIVMERAKPPKPRSVDDILLIAQISDQMHDLSSGQKKEVRQWNYDTIKAFIETSPIYQADYQDIRCRVGRQYGFQKGIVPWNKGIRWTRPITKREPTGKQQLSLLPF